MATIVTRAGKGSALTHTEMDANFTNLNTELGGAGTSVATSSSVSPTFNASSDNVFIHTGLTASSSVTFSNLPTEKQWSYWFDAGVNTNAYDPSLVNEDGLITSNNYMYNQSVNNVGALDSMLSAIDVQSGTYFNIMYGHLPSGDQQTSNARFYDLSPDGTKLIVWYWLGSANRSDMTIFTLSTPWDLTTISRTSYTTPAYKSFGGSYGHVPSFDPAGKGYVIPGQGVYQGTGSYIYGQFSSSTYSTSLGSGQVINAGENVYQAWIGNSGYSVWYVNGNNQTKRINLSTAYNFSTAGSATTITGVAGGTGSYYNGRPCFAPDGKTFFHLVGSHYKILRLSTAWDLTTASADTYLETGNGNTYARESMTKGSTYIAANNTSVYGFKLFDLRSGFRPSFSQIADNPITAIPKTSTHNKVSFMTNNGGTDIYGVATINGAKG